MERDNFLNHTCTSKSKSISLKIILRNKQLNSAVHCNIKQNAYIIEAKLIYHVIFPKILGI